MYLKLNEGVQWYNVLAYFIIQFQANMLVNFMTSFLSFIVKSEDYYNVPKEEAGSILGDLGFYAELSVLVFDILLGTIMDIFGRKIPTISGFVIASAALIAIPFGHNVYPTLCILK